MLRAIVLVPVVVLALGPVAAGQTPFVANHLVSDAAWIASEGDPIPNFIDIVGSEQTLDIPAGTALITWASTMWPDQMSRIRPRIGTSYPADGTVVRGAQSSGSWLTTTEGGTVTIALQVKNETGGTTGQVSGSDSLSWSLLVIPEAAAGNVPAIGTVGFIVMVILVLSAGAVLLLRRRQPVV